MSQQDNQEKRDLLKKNKNRAEFVTENSKKPQRDKYRLTRKIKQKVAELLSPYKRPINSLAQRPGLWSSKIDWQTLKHNLFGWLVESALEGFSANVVTHFLLGWEMNIFTMMAHGFAIKHGLSIYWRMRKHGTDPKLPKKDE